MIPIKDYITNVYEDFKQYLDAENYLCLLKSLNYQGGRKPDYDDIHIQQLYLLRYAFSYAFEYKSMFTNLFAREKYADCIEVVSIGCGNMIDYWALIEALNEVGNTTCIVKYKGLDFIDWNYKIESRKKDELKFIKNNAAEIFEHTSQLVSNVYIFPKSISEFSNEDFEKICDGFKTKEIVKDRIYILISIRSDEGSMDRDMGRSEKIISAMHENGFHTKNKSTEFIYFVNEEKGIKGLDYKFEYPDEAINTIKELNKKCAAFLEEAENCKDDCLKCLNRWPILKAKNIRFQVLDFHREAII
jgi:hypothetical protein